jgi:gas vesicle protein
MAQNEGKTTCTCADLAGLLVAGLIGGLIGVSLGLLLAPKPGAELRSQLRAQADVAAEKAHEVQAKAKDWVEAAKHKLEEHRAAHTPPQEPPPAEGKEA